MRLPFDTVLMPLFFAIVIALTAEHIAPEVALNAENVATDKEMH